MARSVPIPGPSREITEWAPAEGRCLLAGTQGPVPGARGLCTRDWLIIRDWRGRKAAKCGGASHCPCLSKLRAPVTADPQELSCWASGGCWRVRALLQHQEH